MKRYHEDMWTPLSRIFFEEMTRGNVSAEVAAQLSFCKMESGMYKAQRKSGYPPIPSSVLDFVVEVHAHEGKFLDVYSKCFLSILLNLAKEAVTDTLRLESWLSSLRQRKKMKWLLQGVSIWEAERKLMADPQLLDTFQFISVLAHKCTVRQPISDGSNNDESDDDYLVGFNHIYPVDLENAAPAPAAPAPAPAAPAPAPAAPEPAPPAFEDPKDKCLTVSSIIIFEKVEELR
ncbi:hypothetical protein LSTR_LSTR003973 [Laodelphax striatellus]|uniref:Uncharacterized protein n=1 Tax=Laodelphax striatellus TaxID=195883 RepID=A0A482WFJ0_LAOST|nr:hypothetical protein LSTR_LSTR003973 [Laodelphax striatellus]